MKSLNRFCILSYFVFWMSHFVYPQCASLICVLTECLKGIVSEIPSDTPCKEYNARFTTVPLKPLTALPVERSLSLNINSSKTRPVRCIHYTEYPQCSWSVTYSKFPLFYAKSCFQTFKLKVNFYFLPLIKRVASDIS